jgi:DNA-binding winged helix-turn-helix (wHTH) protein
MRGVDIQRGAMTDRAGDERSFDLGRWRVSPSQGLLVSQDTGAEVRLEPQVMALLLFFAGSGGSVLSKDRIIAAVWDGRAIGDDTLAAAVSRLRSALRADADERYIETLPKRGYRLVASVGAEASVGRARASTTSEADRLVDQGKALLRNSAPSGFAQARLYFEAAIRADPGLASAQAGLAETLLAQQLAGQGPAAALLRAGQAAAHAAVGLDSNCAAGWTALGYTHLVVDRDLGRADEALLRAEALTPNDPAPRRYRAFALVAAGRLVEAEREAREAVALDTLSVAARAGLLQVLLAARRFGPAIAEAKALLDLAPESADGWYALGWARVLKGETNEGVQTLLRGLSLWGVSGASLEALKATFSTEGLAGLCAAGADLFQTQQIVFKPRLTDIAMLRAVAGQADLAFAALEAAADRLDPFLLFAPHLPWLDSLNNDPRWRPLIERTRAR